MRTTIQLFSFVALALACAVCPISTAAADDPVAVEFDTSEGKFVMELNAEKAPKTVENFLKYVESGHYDGTVFHRVIPDFMIQGGGFDQALKEKETLPPVRNEGDNGLTNDRYTVAMARTPDPHSATAQFFVNTSAKLGGNSSLNRAEARDGFGYTVFGKVTKGTEVVDKIGATKTQSIPDPARPNRLMSDVPATSIVIKSAKVRTPVKN
jgi:cyclophilin family peptidyl-prolyl cis-trans isomerase